MENSDIFKEVERVKKVYFPRWDKKNQWKFEICTRDEMNGAHGKCLDDKKIIRFEYREGEKLTLLLIHEICHAVADAGHRKKWAQRMEKAARKAVSVGEIGINTLIQEELQCYAQSMDLKAEDMYRQIEDVVMYNPKLPYEDAIKFVSEKFGYSPQDLQQKFTLCRRKYDEAVKNHGD